MTSTAPHDAVMVADALLESVPRQQVCDEFWQTAALRPLAALLTSTAVDLRHDACGAGPATAAIRSQRQGIVTMRRKDITNTVETAPVSPIGQQ